MTLASSLRLLVVPPVWKGRKPSCSTPLAGRYRQAWPVVAKLIAPTTHWPSRLTFNAFADRVDASLDQAQGPVAPLGARAGSRWPASSQPTITVPS
jgi:hypothetical protein